MTIHSLSVAVKLGFAFALITLITVGVGVFSIIEFKKETKLTEKMHYYPYSVSNAIKSIHIDILSIHLLMHSMMEDYTKDNLDDVSKKIKEHDISISKNFEIIFERHIGSRDDVKKAFDIYFSSYKQRMELIEIIKTNDMSKAENFMRINGSQCVQDMQEKISFLNEIADNKANELFNKAKKQEENAILFLTVIIFSFVILSLIIAVMTIRGIVTPLQNLIETTKQINSGELSMYDNEVIPNLAKREDEIGLLFNSFHTLMTYLLLPYKDIIKSNRPLVEKTDELRRLLNSFDKYIIASKTDINGKIIYVSKAYENISGYSREELIGHTQNITRHPDMPKETFRNLWQTIKSGKTWSGNIKNKTKDGGYFWINVIVSPDVDSKGEIVGYNAISENVTAAVAYKELSQTLENRVEEEIKKNNEKTTYMLQQSRLAQMGEMISMIAHQWRQPLASISAISATLTLDLMMKNFNEKFFKERLKSISELSQYLSQTIDDFRSFFKEDKKKESSSIQKIVDGCMQVMGSALKSKNIHVIMKIEDDIIIHSYLNEIKQVILNICKNAEDALMEANTEEATIWVSGYTEGFNACISIEDNAGGVNLAYIDKIFDPYFSTKKNKDGTGLGLYMSKTIIEEHCQGKLILHNTKQGACFTIKLPLEYEKEIG
ncbi:PAS domain S-box protein [bacterium]|nr:PAS domain S-box protein [bacterium]MBU1993946.1 PAS domain S-box protein [bacterium]